jgi:hypothetical protein
MKFEDMKLTYGYPLQLQTTNASGQPERFSCRLIGCLPGRSVLLSVPKVGGKLVRLRTGQKIVARLMVDNGVGIFASIVDTQTIDPYPILHVSYPESVSFKGIRGATRVSIEQPASVINMTRISDQIVSGIVVDISVTGARIEIDEPVGEIGDSIQLNMQVNVAGIQRGLSIDSIIRSRVEADPQNVGFENVIAYGIEFTEKDDDKRLLLFAYVYTQIGIEDVIG